MARSFSEEEREHLKQEMYHVGEVFFKQKGVSGTKVEDITEAVGISKGAFYHFFPSKEEFFFDMIDMLHEGLFVEIERRIKEEGKLEDKIRKLLSEVWLQSDIFMFMLQGGEITSILKKIPPERIAHHLHSDESTAQRMLELIKCDMAQVDPHVVANLFKAITLFNTNRELMDQEAFEKTNEVLIDMIVDYIMKGYR